MQCKAKQSKAQQSCSVTGSSFAVLCCDACACKHARTRITAQQSWNLLRLKANQSRSKANISPIRLCLRGSHFFFPISLCLRGSYFFLQLCCAVMRVRASMHAHASQHCKAGTCYALGTQSKAKRSKARQSKAEQSNVKQGKAK